MSITIAEVVNQMIEELKKDHADESLDPANRNRVFANDYYLDLLLDCKKIDRMALEGFIKQLAKAAGVAKPVIEGQLKIRSDERIKEAKEAIRKARAEAANAAFPMKTINLMDYPNMNNQVLLGLEALYRLNEAPKIFKRGGKMCMVTQSNPGEYAINSLKNSVLQSFLSAAIPWTKWSKGEDPKEHEVYPPSPVVDGIIAMGEWDDKIPWLKAITASPIMDNDGSIITTPGFDPKTGFYYAPPEGFVMPPIPDHPTKQDAIDAAAWLDQELFCDFPFVDNASRTNIMAALLTTTLRYMIDNVTPLMLMDKNGPGTGATKIVDVISLVAVGIKSSPTKDPGTEEEWRKTLLSMVVSGNPINSFDNLDQDLESSSFSQALTSSSISGRILGHTAQAAVLNRFNWFGTGNNVNVAGDMTRRICLIRQDAKMPNPCTREGPKTGKKWYHPKLEKWVNDNRGEILVKIYTIVRAWIQSGRPDLNTVVMGSFEEWTDIIGSLLVFSDRKDFMANAMWLSESSTIVDEWEVFIHAFHAEFGDKETRASQIMVWIKSGGAADVLPTAIVDVIGKRGEISAVSLGKIIAKKRDVRYDNGLMWKVRTPSNGGGLYSAVEFELIDDQESEESDGKEPDKDVKDEDVKDVVKEEKSPSSTTHKTFADLGISFPPDRKANDPPNTYVVPAIADGSEVFKCKCLNDVVECLDKYADIIYTPCLSDNIGKFGANYIQIRGRLEDHGWKYSGDSRTFARAQVSI